MKTNQLGNTDVTISTIGLGDANLLVVGHQESEAMRSSIAPSIYGGVCYAPLYLFCGKHLLAAKLRG